MNVENWTEGEYPETSRTVVVAEFADRKLWQFIDMVDERQGVDPEEIAVALEGFAWEADVVMEIHWKGSKDTVSTFAAYYEAGKLWFDSQHPQEFARMSYGLRGKWADCHHDGSLELYDDQARWLLRKPENN